MGTCTQRTLTNNWKNWFKEGRHSLPTSVTDYCERERNFVGSIRPCTGDFCPDIKVAIYESLVLVLHALQFLDS